MTDYEDEEELSAEEQKKKKGDGEAEGAARSEANVSQGFFDFMVSIGASKMLITEVLRNWRHLKGEGLLRRVMEFARGLVKSNHIEVEIDRGKDYAVVHNFIQSTKQAQAPIAKVTPVQQQMAKHKHMTPGLNLINVPKPPS
jgi:hypothetical protein